MIQPLLQDLKLIRMLNFDSHCQAGPLWADIAVTSACNYQCSFCGTHSPRLKEKPLAVFMDGGLLNNLFADLAEMGTQEVLFAGNGEPFLSRDLLRAIRQYGHRLKVKVMTNGSMLGQVDKELFANLYKLTISLNSGNGHSHMAVHGYKGYNHFPYIERNIERLLSYPGGRRKIEMSYVVTEANAGEVVDFKALCRRWRVKSLIRPEDARATTGITEKQSKLHPCYLGFIQPAITAGGSVQLCCGYAKSMGNLSAQTFKAIWQSGDYREARFQAVTMRQTGKAVSPNCYGCPNAVASSRVFHNTYSRIPLLGRWVK